MNRYRRKFGVHLHVKTWLDPPFSFWASQSRNNTLAVHYITGNITHASKLCPNVHELIKSTSQYHENITPNNMQPSIAACLYLHQGCGRTRTLPAPGLVPPSWAPRTSVWVQPLPAQGGPCCQTALGNAFSCLCSLSVTETVDASILSSEHIVTDRLIPLLEKKKNVGFADRRQNWQAKCKKEKKKRIQMWKQISFWMMMKRKSLVRSYEYLDVDKKFGKMGELIGFPWLSLLLLPWGWHFCVFLAKLFQNVRDGLRWHLIQTFMGLRRNWEKVRFLNTVMRPQLEFVLKFTCKSECVLAFN